MGKTNFEIITIPLKSESLWALEDAINSLNWMHQVTTREVKSVEEQNPQLRREILIGYMQDFLCTPFNELFDENDAFAITRKATSQDIFRP